MIALIWKIWLQLLLRLIEWCQCFCQKDQKVVFETMRILPAAYRDVFSGKSYGNFTPKAFLRFKSLAIQELSPKIWIVVDSAVGNADAWVPICVCFGMPWFRGSQPVTSSGSPHFLGWCSQNVWRPVPAYNKRASTSGEIPKSTVLACKLIIGSAISRVQLFPSTNSSYTQCSSSTAVTYESSHAAGLYIFRLIKCAMAISCCFLISP